MFEDEFCNFTLRVDLGCLFIYKKNNIAVGFATIYFSYTSSITAKVAILNDLFTIPEMRNKGIGKKLIEHCRDFSIENKAARLQWLTAPDNKIAQHLYDSLGAVKSTWKFYTY